MRKRIYEIIEKSNGKDIISSIYDYLMIVIITAGYMNEIEKDKNKGE